MTIEQMVHNQLYGHTDVQSLTPNAGSIVYKIQNGDSLTLAETRFLRSTPIPLYKLLSDVQQDPLSVAYMAKVTERALVQFIAVNMGNAIISTVNTAFSGDKDKPLMPDVVKEGISQLSREISDVTRGLPEITNFVNGLSELARNIKLSFPTTPMPTKHVR